jgi:hypothetical protein
MTPYLSLSDSRRHAREVLPSRIVELAKQGHNDREIAKILLSEGIERSSATVGRIRKRELGEVEPLLSHLTDAPQCIETIISKSGMSPAGVARRLGRLEKQGKVMKVDIKPIPYKGRHQIDLTRVPRVGWILVHSVGDLATREATAPLEGNL